MLKEPILLTEDSVRYAMLGGSILGGGGGGAAESGGQTGRLAVRRHTGHAGRKACICRNLTSGRVRAGVDIEVWGAYGRCGGEHACRGGRPYHADRRYGGV